MLAKREKDGDDLKLRELSCYRTSSIYGTKADGTHPIRMPLKIRNQLVQTPHIFRHILHKQQQSCTNNIRGALKQAQIHYDPFFGTPVLGPLIF